jgi:hypothetical protein
MESPLVELGAKESAANRVNRECARPFPVPLSLAANRLAHAAAQRNASLLNLSKRRFLVSAFGAASTLL